MKISIHGGEIIKRTLQSNISNESPFTLDSFVLWFMPAPEEALRRKDAKAFSAPTIMHASSDGKLRQKSPLKMRQWRRKY
ncbi:hypothetical protein CEXT_171721 [Caerostris extrusa]|uniref:Uncharacterized protein n=1 Tax=Caerostris extrusa TaxID=172846 RepID=A0AAV4V5G3_CAEEX|nr:hypothetical protein CEXT_171721 [Caerostris extrusa]